MSHNSAESGFVEIKLEASQPLTRMDLLNEGCSTYARSTFFFTKLSYVQDLKTIYENNSSKKIRVRL